MQSRIVKTIYFSQTSIFTKLIILFLLGLSLLSIFFLFTQSIRLDEAQSIWVSTKPVLSILDFSARDVHVPLYFLLLHFWILFFGPDIIAARSLSLVFFLLTVPLLYYLTRTLVNKQTALLTVTLFALSPFILWYSSEARMYTLFTFISTLNNLFFIRFFRSEGQKSKVEYFLSAVFGLYTHYFFIFLLFSQFAFVLVRFVYLLYQNRKFNSVQFKKVFVEQSLFFLKFTILQVLAFAFLVPWLLYVYFLGSASNTQPQIPPPNGYSLLQAFSLFLFGFQPQGLQSIFISFWPLLVMLLLFVFTQRRSNPLPEINFLVTVTFLPVMLVFIISFFRPIFLVRYLILVTPTLFFLLSWFLMNYSKKLSLYLSSLLIVILIGLLFTQNLSAQTPAKENYEQVTDYLELQTKPQDIIIVSAPFTIYPIEYSYGGNTKIETIPEWNRFSGSGIPSFSEDKLIEQIDRYKKQYHNMYVVLSYDQGYQEKVISYLDNNLERLDLIHFSENLEIRVYRLRYDI